MLSRLRSLWRNLAHRDRMQRDVDDEVRAMFTMLNALTLKHIIYDPLLQTNPSAP